jgi:frataxin-like iron-binding protein CyaY
MSLSEMQKINVAEKRLIAMEAYKHIWITTRVAGRVYNQQNSLSASRRRQKRAYRHYNRYSYGI